MKRLHDNLMLSSVDNASASEFIRRVSLTRILESLVTDPSRYLKNHRQEAIFNASIYSNPKLQEKMSDRLMYQKKRLEFWAKVPF